MLDAVRYLVDNGVKWTALPVDFPYWRAVYDFFRRWRACDYARELYERLRRTTRERSGRNAEPSGGIIDSQSVDASETVGEDSRGYDGGKFSCLALASRRSINPSTDGITTSSINNRPPAVCPYPTTITPRRRRSPCSSNRASLCRNALRLCKAEG
ncbi:transposase [Streptomyces sp. NPDC058382]|uniref:transposase n=1 Tax=unclassified Streptomyces TaxID=2593676 RepID=UPI003630CC4B